MEVEFLEDNKEKVKLEITGEGHTLCNSLVKELWKDDKVDVAGYSIDHSLISNPIVTVQGSNVKASLKKAIENLGKTLKEMDDNFKKAK
jgi:DNA-directed RNA polymerase subunit L